ncbi:hypothetical protein [Methylobacterium sp. E-041]
MLNVIAALTGQRIRALPIADLARRTVLRIFSGSRDGSRVRRA